MLRVAEEHAQSDTGRQRRSNEDSYFRRAPVFAVADGMGGARAGEVASRILVETLEPGLPDEGPDEERLAARVREANQRIYELAQADADRAGMGTTVTAAVVGDAAVSLAHVGDSRAYRWRDGGLEQMTRDHSLVEELLRRGKLTPEEAADHPQKSVITRALGPEAAVDVDKRSVPAQDGDVFLLCSDGLTAMVHDARIAEVLRSSSSLAQAGRALIAAANEAGGRDNITVVLFRLEDVAHVAQGTDQPTQVGIAAPPAEQVAAATRQPPPPPRRTAPLPPRTGGATQSSPPKRRRRIRGVVPVLVTLAILGVIAAALFTATREVYFVGTEGGFVSVFRGLPYEGPGGLKLYTREYVSGVPAAQLPPARRKSILTNSLRSQNDAADLVRKLELGQVTK
ncbi:MAG TPA: Stp1/IreP family PP2C-type Ser/Thr phosphatase [Solirubrobacteraceae bacterium]